MAKIGFIGLGIMGTHMAANLIRAGHDVTGYDVVAASVDKLLQAGGKPAPDIAEAVAGAGVIITIASVSGSSWNAARQSMCVVPITGSPPMPTHVEKPMSRSSYIIW